MGFGAHHYRAPGSSAKESNKFFLRGRS